LADEINRTPPKTQAALLEAMQVVTIAGENYKLDLPYFVLATQNPIEQEVLILCLRPSWIVLCLLSSSNTLLCRRSSGKRTTSDEINTINSLFTAQEIIDFQQLIRRIPVAERC
jgi:MoxR-like ATPase